MTAVSVLRVMFIQLHRRDDVFQGAEEGVGGHADHFSGDGHEFVRQLLPLIEAAREMPGVQVLLWGDGHQRAAVEAAVAQVPNTRYLGWLPASQVPLHTRLADVIYYCLVPDYPGAVYNAPNTLSNAMAAGRPIIANDVGDLGRIVRETGCGVLVPAVTPEEIREAVETLRDPAVRQRLGRAGRAAAEARYNWAAAERQLEQVYAELTGR